VAEVLVTPRAQRDINEAIAALGLPADTWARIASSLRLLETFPLAGRPLDGRWAPARFALGPWPWMILLYVHDELADTVHLVAVHDARVAISPRSTSG
jgi:plasmid stabilization system protein ParE